MNKEKFKAVVTVVGVSLGVASAIASLVGLACWLFGLSFWAGFSLALAVQGIGGQMWNYIVDKRTEILLSRTEADIALAQSVHEVDLTCAYCHVTNRVPIFAGRENAFDCIGCNSPCKVQFDISVVRVTTPVAADRQTKEIFQNIESAPETEVSDPINEEQLDLNMS